jgi:hypothetical protein
MLQSKQLLISKTTMGLNPLRLLTCMMSTSSTTTTSTTYPTLQAPPSARVHYKNTNNGNSNNNGVDEATKRENILSVESTMNYCADWVTAPYTRRDLQGSDDGLIDVEWKSVTTNIHNARLFPKQLDKHGFEWVERPVKKNGDGKEKRSQHRSSLAWFGGDHCLQSQCDKSSFLSFLVFSSGVAAKLCALP